MTVCYSSYIVRERPPGLIFSSQKKSRFASEFLRIFAEEIAHLGASKKTRDYWGSGKNLGRGRGTVGKCTGPKWSKRPFWSKCPYSELDFSIRETKMVHFGLKRSILVHLSPPTVLWPYKGIAKGGVKNRNKGGCKRLFAFVHVCSRLLAFVCVFASAFACVCPRLSAFACVCSHFWKATKEYLNQRGTKIRVFRVCFRTPFRPPFSPHFPTLFPLQALFTLTPLLPSSPPP